MKGGCVNLQETQHGDYSVAGGELADNYHYVGINGRGGW